MLLPNIKYNGGKICIFSTHLLSLNSNFLKFGSLGKPFNDVRPTFMRLRDSKLQNSSVRPVIVVLRQLSKFNSLICNANVVKKIFSLR